MKRNALAAAVIYVLIVSGSASSAIPPKYRYTGALATYAGPPTHYVTEGDGFKFYFRDSAVRVSRYRLCVGQPRSAPAKCWTRRARYGVDIYRTGNIREYPNPTVPFGPLTARWIVGSRTVALWPFYYAPEGE